MARDGNVLHMFNEYVQAFQALRAPAVTSYFHLPCMLVAPQGVGHDDFPLYLRVPRRRPPTDSRREKAKILSLCVR
jgi:hypothetical protein